MDVLVISKLVDNLVIYDFEGICVIYDFKLKSFNVKFRKCLKREFEDIRIYNYDLILSYDVFVLI